MISRVINEKDIDKVRNLLVGSDKIVITCHLTPDGDAIGSSLGLMHTLNAIGKNAVVVTPDLVPKSLQFRALKILWRSPATKNTLPGCWPKPTWCSVLTSTRAAALTAWSLLCLLPRLPR